MPDVQGLWQIEAEQQLRDAGVSVSAIYQRDDLAPAGRVLFATPSAGTVLGLSTNQTEKVEIMVSAGLRADTGAGRAEKAGWFLGAKMKDEAHDWLRSLVGIRSPSPSMPNLGTGEMAGSLLPIPLPAEATQAPDAALASTSYPTPETGLALPTDRAVPALSPSVQDSSPSHVAADIQADLISRLQTDDDFAARLVDHIYPRVEQRLKREFRVNREQVGMTADNNYH
ncbi:PASTA domain-containing protein [Streptomyces sp. NPDC055085]